MLLNLKMNVAAIAITGLIVFSTITAPLTKIFGKNYNNAKDYSCCKGNQLVIHHYYTFDVFWVEVADGYTEELTAQKEAPGACVIKCNE